jgi:hypothetical protein
VGKEGVISGGVFDQGTHVSGDLKLLSGGQVENVSVPFSVFFLNI